MISHWFHRLPYSGESPEIVKEWERKAREMDTLATRLKELKREFKKLDEAIYKHLRKDWCLEEIYTASALPWKAPDWWEFHI